jgi:hypothetical protein
MAESALKERIFGLDIAAKQKKDRGIRSVDSESGQYLSAAFLKKTTNCFYLIPASAA